MIGIEDLVRSLAGMTVHGQSADQIVALALEEIDNMLDLQQKAQLTGAVVAEYAAATDPGPVRNEVIRRLTPTI